MNDLINNQAQPVQVVDAAPVDAAAKQLAKEVESIEKQYFSVAKLADGSAYAEKCSEIANRANLEVVFNFEPEEEFPAGYGLAVAPINKTEGGKTVTVGIAVAAIPEVETIQANENGNDYIAKVVQNAMIAKLMNAVRPRGESGETAASVPFTVEDFITVNRADGVLKAFRSLAGTYVKTLKKKGLSFLTENILRQVLQSAASAKQHFPAIDQTKWEFILRNMIDNAKSQGLAPGMLEDWLATRDSAELEVKDVDLSDIDFDAAFKSDDDNDDNDS